MALPVFVAGGRAPPQGRSVEGPRGLAPVASMSRAPVNTRSPSVLGRGAAAFGRAREVAALVAWTLAVFLALALASYPDQNWVGPSGELAARALVSLVGGVAWALPLELFLLGIPVVRGKDSAATPGRIAGDLLM